MPLDLLVQLRVPVPLLIFSSKSSLFREKHDGHNISNARQLLCLVLHKGNNWANLLEPRVLLGLISLAVQAKKLVESGSS